MNETHIRPRWLVEWPWEGSRSASTSSCFELSGWPFTLKQRSKRRMSGWIMNLCENTFKRHSWKFLEILWHKRKLFGIDKILPQLNIFNLVLPRCAMPTFRTTLFTLWSRCLFQIWNLFHKPVFIVTFHVRWHVPQAVALLAALA